MQRNFGNRQEYDRSPPVSEGEELDVRIEAVGDKGDGVAKKDGFVLFIPGVQAGDEVRVKVTKVLRKVGFAEVVGKPEGPLSDDAKEDTKTKEAPQKPAEEEFNYDESKDSEDFGEDEDDEEKQ